MARKKETGICCICGKNGELSFEHVPPKAAYNQDTIIEYSWGNYFTDKKLKPKIMQGGAGAYTLCESCNNNTGAWYGGEYVKWARICRDIMVMWNQKQTLSGSVELKNVYPLRFLKQIVACFCSLRASDGTFFIEKYPELVPFILDKNNENLPSGLRFFMNLYIESPEVTQLRRVGVAILAKVKDNLEIIKSVPFGEITHPPFQLIMTYDYGTFDDATEITIFQNFSYDQISNVEIPLRIVLSDNPLPGMG